MGVTGVAQRVTREDVVVDGRATDSTGAVVAVSQALQCPIHGVKGLFDPPGNLIIDVIHSSNLLPPGGQSPVSGLTRRRVNDGTIERRMALSASRRDVT